MIGELLINLFFSIFRGFFLALDVISLPTQLIGVLAEIMCFGTWMVGADLLAVFVGTVIFWWGVHMSIGLAVWVWKMLPLI